jgi:hypothetical protein
MNVLIIGDEHTYGYGLSGGKLSYVGHFIRQISRTGQSVSVEAYAHLTTAQIVRTLDQLPLSRYDLIILQLDETISQPARFGTVSTQRSVAPTLPFSVETIKSRGQLGWFNTIKAISYGLVSIGLSALARSPRMLAALLKQLRPYRHRVLLLTPLPQRKPLNQWLRRRSRITLLEKAEDQLFSVFDSDAVIRPQEEYFLPNDGEHLNAISHELLGRSLYDFYESAPTIVTIQTIKQQYRDNP